MMLKTHLAISILAILLFLPHVTGKVLFICVALVATIIPDIDSAYSTAGRGWIFRVLQFFVKHRGILHSFTLAVLISIAIAWFFPTLAFGFFLGYSVHLLADSFTKDGIVPFWPYRKTSSWHISTGGRMETSVFIIFTILDLVVFAFMIISTNV